MRVAGKNSQRRQGALLQGCLHKEYVGLAARTLRYVEYGAFMKVGHVRLITSAVKK